MRPHYIGKYTISSKNGGAKGCSLKLGFFCIHPYFFYLLKKQFWKGFLSWLQTKLSDFWIKNTKVKIEKPSVPFKQKTNRRTSSSWPKYFLIFYKYIIKQHTDRHLCSFKWAAFYSSCLYFIFIKTNFEGLIQTMSHGRIRSQHRVETHTTFCRFVLIISRISLT